MRCMIFILCLLIGNAWADNPLLNNSEKKGTHTEQRGTNQHPLIISGEIISKKNSQEIEDEAVANKEKSAIDNALVEYTQQTAVYTGLLFLVAFAQAGLFVWQLRLMRQSTKDAGDAARAAEKAAAAAEHSIKVSRDAYIASERPWVSVAAAVSTDLCKKSHGIEFGVHFTVKNYGKSPAIDVHIVYEVVTLRIASDQFGGVRQRIAELGTKTNMGMNMGVQLFPDEEKVIPWVNTLNNKEIQEATQSHQPPAGLLPSFYVVGAVFYKSAFSEEIHQTGFNYYVCAIGEPRYPKGSDVPDFAATFPRERIILDPVPYYKGTID